MSITASIVLPHKATLGEGPIWDERAQCLAWVDILEKTVFLFDPATKTNRALKTPTDVGTIVPRRAGGYVVALREDIAALDPASGALTTLHHLDNPGAKLRYNDGKCDPLGRLWVGTLAYDNAAGAAALYRVDHRFDAKQAHSRQVEGITCSNGIAWSLDQRTMYYIDTPTRRVDAFDFDAAAGTIANRRPAIGIPADQGYPDGMTMDAEGMLWIGMWGGGVVLRADPRTGKLIGRIEVPGARNATACAFGGRNLDELYITTASLGVTGDEATRQPNAGFLFMAKPGVRGLPACAFAG